MGREKNDGKKDEVRQANSHVVPTKNAEQFLSDANFSPTLDKSSQNNYQTYIRVQR